MTAAAVGAGHPGERVRGPRALVELLALRDPGSQPASQLAQCVLGPEARAPASDTAETATAFKTVDGSTRCSCSSSTVPGSLAGSRVNRRRAPTSTPAPAVTATHHRLPSNQPGVSGSVNHRSVPAFTIARNANAANASTTPNTTAFRIRPQNPGDRVKASPSGAAPRLHEAASARS